MVDQSKDPAKSVQEYCKSHASLIRYFHVTHFRGLPQARNFGWQQASYPFVIYIDDDIRCQPDFVQEHVKSLENSKIDLVAGGDAGRPHQRPSRWPHWKI